MTAWKTVIPCLMTSEPCECLSPAADVAYAAARAAIVYRQLIDESHFIVTVRRCPCGQHWLQAFCETVDWVDSNDPQSRVLIPLDELEATRLAGLRPDACESDLGPFGGERRYLLWDHPRQGEPTVKWVAGPVSIPPHD